MTWIRNLGIPMEYTFHSQVFVCIHYGAQELILTMSFSGPILILESASIFYSISENHQVCTSQLHAATLEFGGKSRSNELSRKVGMELPLFDARIQLVLVYFDYLGPIQILDMFQNCCM